MDRQVPEHAGYRVPALSYVLPFYRRLADFRAALRYNLSTFSRPECEVVLVVDDPSDADETVELARDTPGIRWRVLVNPRPHSWRSPSKPLNVGIRHATGQHVLVTSPESVFVDDPVALLARTPPAARPGAMLLGRLSLAVHGELGGTDRASLAAAFEADQRHRASPIFWGSLCAPRAALHAVTGYDESLTKWGGDDLNLRLRLQLHGLAMVPRPDLRLIHLSQTRRAPEFAPPAGVPMHSEEETRRLKSPAEARANGDDWGTDFDDVALDWRAGGPALVPVATSQGW